MTPKQYGYTGIDERSKVRFLNNSIKTTKLDAPKLQTMASAELRKDFCVPATLYKDFVAQMIVHDHSDRQISDVRTGNFLKDAHYVPKAEWNAMSQDKRDAVILARKNARKNGTGGGGYKGGKGGGPPMTTFLVNIKLELNGIPVLVLYKVMMNMPRVIQCTRQIVV